MFGDVVVADAARLGVIELALSALRVHGSDKRASYSICLLLHTLCIDEACAIKAKQLGAPVLLQAALKAHRSDDIVQKTASDTLARIQHFVDAACARAEANIADLIAGEEAAKVSKGTAAAPKKAGKGKGKSRGGAATGPPPPHPPPPPPPPPPPLAAAGDISILTKAQIKRREAKAAAAVRKAVAACGPAASEEEDEEEEGSDASSDDSEPFRPRRPPLDFSADGEFRRGLNLPPRPGIEAEIDKMVAEIEARHAAQLAAAFAMPPAMRNAVGDKEGAVASDGVPFSLGRAAAPALPPLPPNPTLAAVASSPAAAPDTAPPAATAAAEEPEHGKTWPSVPSSHGPPSLPAPPPAPGAQPPCALATVKPSPAACERATDLTAEVEALRAENALHRTTIDAIGAQIDALRAEKDARVGEKEEELSALRARVAALGAALSSLRQ